MESKSHQIYRQRVEYLVLHLETVYGALSFTSKYLNGRNEKKDTISKYLGKDFNELNHPLTEVTRIFNYSKSNICQSFIVDLYKAFDEYLRNLLEEVFNNKPEMILGLSDESVNFTGSDIIELHDYSTICKKLVSDIYRKLENIQSSKKMLEKIIKVFKLSIGKQMIQDALSVLELRHLIIHNKGLVDTVYVKNFPNMKLDAGKKIPTKISFVFPLEKKVSDLVNNTDNSFISKEYIKSI